MPVLTQREKVHFISGDAECAAERAVAAELSFLRRHLLDHPRADRPAPAPAVSAPQRGGWS